MDRSGKDTQIGLIARHFSDEVSQVFHYSKLPFDNVDEAIAYSKRGYDDMFKIMEENKDRERNLIFNRSHLGEAVYSPIYRDRDGDYVFDIEKKYVESLKENLFLIVLVNDSDILIKRDDGNSQSKNEDDIKTEVTMFYRAFMLSEIHHKMFLNVGTKTPAEVFDIILNFLNVKEFA